MTQKVGILGSGIVGQTLALGFFGLGYEVMVGSEHPEKLQEWSAKHPEIKIGDCFQAANFSDLLVLCVKGTAAETVMRVTGVEKLAGKIVIDTTNPLADEPPKNGVLKYFTSPNESLMERLQQLSPQAKFVKAFNSVGNSFMVNPDFGGIKPTMFICGNDQDAKKQVTSILEKFGWDAEDCGGAEGARAIEPLCMLWCIPGFLRNDWSHAFKVLRK